MGRGSAAAGLGVGQLLHERIAGLWQVFVLVLSASGRDGGWGSALGEAMKFTGGKVAVWSGCAVCDAFQNRFC